MGVFGTLVFDGFAVETLRVCFGVGEALRVSEDCSGVGEALGVSEDCSGVGERLSLGLSEGLGLWVGATIATSCLGVLLLGINHPAKMAARIMISRKTTCLFRTL